MFVGKDRESFLGLSQEEDGVVGAFRILALELDVGHHHIVISLFFLLGLEPQLGLGFFDWHSLFITEGTNFQDLPDYNQI